ncbi:hypothetical protein H0X06_01295 [Candidatus Dependentiae bacterium]|nr:hypothetical protein [Candidatus Dependentiae bacterium]
MKKLIIAGLMGLCVGPASLSASSRTEGRIVKAIYRQDNQKVEQLLRKRGYLEKSVKERFLKAAQQFSEDYKEKNTILKSTPDLAATVIGVTSLALAAYGFYPELSALARGLQYSAQWYLEPDDIKGSSVGKKFDGLGAALTPAKSATDSFSREAVRVFGSMALFIGGVVSLKYGLHRTVGIRRFKNARVIEELVDATAEVGSFDLNVRRD